MLLQFLPSVSPSISPTLRWRPGVLLLIALVALGGCLGRDPLEVGREYMAKGSYPEAVIEFKNAVQAKPESVDARLALADGQEHMHDLAGAEQQLRKALSSGGDENVLVPRIALTMLDRGDLDKLVRDFKDRRLSNPEADSTLRGTVAIAYVGLKRMPLAEAQLQDTVATPTEALARAQLLFADGKIADALAKLGPVSSSNNAPWWVLRAASRIASVSGDFTKSLELIKRAQTVVPWHRGVMGEYGEALVADGKFDEATVVRDQLRKQAPNYFWTHYLDAVLLARAGMSEESHAAALKVLAISPGHPPATLIAASAELQKGDLLMADKRLQALVKQNPNSLPALRLLAQSQFRSGKMREVDYIVRRGLAMAPGDPQLLSLRAEFEYARGDRKQAAATLMSVLALHPEDANTQLRLAEMKASLGDRSGATSLLEQASVAAKQDAALRARVVAAALRMGSPDLARRLADAGVAALPDDPQAQLTLAATQSALNDRASAWATTLAVLDKKPAIPMALTALSAMAKTPEQRQEVLVRYAKAIDAKVTSPRVYLDYANLLQSAPDAKESSLAALEKGLMALPQAVPIRAALVDEYLRIGSAEKAVSTAETGASISNAPALAVELQAATYERVGKVQLATEGYRKLAANYPQRPDWRLKLAQLEAAANRNAEASTILRALITERPFDMPAYLALAKLSTKDNPAEALSIARQMEQREELVGASMLLAGDILMDSGKAEEALKQFDKAVKAGMVPVGLLRAVRVLDQTGRTSSADQEMDDVLKRYPNDTSVMEFAAKRALAAGRSGTAVDLLKKLVAKSPGSPVALNDLAWAQIQAGRPSEALENARNAAAALPNSANVMDTLGMALALSGKREEAIASLRTATNLAPLAALPRLHLSEQLLASGDRDGAMAALRSVNQSQLDQSSKATFAKLTGLLGTL